MEDNNLTPKQQLFVDNYINNDGDHIQAYKDSGYTATSDNSLYAGVNRLLKNVKVSAQIARYKANNLAKQAKKREKIDINETWLINRYLDVIDGAMQSKHWNAARNCITDIGKLTGHVYSRQSIELQGTIDHAIQSLDSDQLIQALTEAKHPKAIEAEFHEIADD
jgi:hypothetical protein